MSSLVTVAIPVLNAGPPLGEVLAAVDAQRVSAEVEVLICDSGSDDGSPELARRRGATVIEIERREFSHGGTRNLLMKRSGGDHVAFLTQDAVPADEHWLSGLLGGFSLTEDVGLVFGPYRPRAGASPMVARELTEWFASLAPDGAPRIDRLAAPERDTSPRTLLGPRGFFTDANGCVSRRAWEKVPFREIAYAEDHALAHDMLRAGFAKVFVPAAAVVHSHEYTAWGWVQRSFDEGRALQTLYGWREPLDPRTAALNLWGRVGADWRWAGRRRGRLRGTEALRLLGESTLHHGARMTGTMLGTRANHLPVGLAGVLSRERRPRR